MNRCARLLSSSKVSVYLSLVSAVLAVAALEAGGQDSPTEKQQPTDVFQKASFKRPEKMCSVPAAGAVTALVKTGVELSVTDDWDCDGVPDAYDNCVGIANASQDDAGGNGIGDVCESAATISSGLAPGKLKKKTHARSMKSEGDRKKKKKTDARSQKSEGSRKRKSVASRRHRER